MLKRLSQSRLARQAATVMSLDVVAKLCGMLSMILYANGLGVALYGQFTFVFALTQIFSIGPDMGLFRWSVREVSMRESTAWTLLRATLRMRVWLGLSTVAIGLVTAWILDARFESASLPLLMAIALAALWVKSFRQGYDTLFHGLQRLDLSARINMVMRGATLVFAPALAWWTQSVAILLSALLLVEILEAWLAGRVAERAFGDRQADTHDLGAKDIQFRRIFMGALPFSLQQLATLACFYIDSVMLGLYWGDEMVGRYGAAYRLILAALVVPTGLCNVLYPALSKAAPADRARIFVKSLPAYLAMGLGFVAVVWPLREFWVERVLYRSGEYAESIPLLGMLAFAFPVYCLTMGLGNVFAAAGRQKAIMYLSFTMLALNLTLNALWIPSMAAKGAAAATIATEVFGLAVYLAMCGWWWVGRSRGE